MGFKDLKNEEDFFKDKNEPIKSTLNIFLLAPDFHQIYKKGLLPREVGTLICNGYNLNKDKINPKRYKIFNDFKNYLKVKYSNDIDLNQDKLKPGRNKINEMKKKGKDFECRKCGRYVNEPVYEKGKYYCPHCKNEMNITSTRIEDLFHKLLQRLKEKGWLDVRKEGDESYYSINEKQKSIYSLIKIKNWHKDIISKTDGKNLLVHNSKINTGEYNPRFLFYFYNGFFDKNYLSDGARFSLKHYMNNIQSDLIHIADIFNTAAKRKFNEIWCDFINNFNIKYIYKFFIWIALVGYQVCDIKYFDVKKASNRLKEKIHPIAREHVVEDYKKLNIDPDDYNFLSSHEYIERKYNEYLCIFLRYYFFEEIIWKAAVLYMEKNYPSDFKQKEILLFLKNISMVLQITIEEIKMVNNRFLFCYESPRLLSTGLEKHKNSLKQLLEILETREYTDFFKMDKETNSGEILDNESLLKERGEIKEGSLMDHLGNKYGYQRKKYDLSFKMDDFFSRTNILEPFKNKIDEFGFHREGFEDPYKGLLNELNYYGSLFHAPE